ncbi:hypothetical protein J4440_03815 [Candidatus Woesearchaeota archaeon]|nr:hypothetical protein [Candidatus Woesearchaeota archaeon]
MVLRRDSFTEKFETVSKLFINELKLEKITKKELMDIIKNMKNLVWN